MQKKAIKILFLGVDTDSLRSLVLHLDNHETFSIHTNFTKTDEEIPWAEATEHSNANIIILSVDQNWQQGLSSVPASLEDNGQALVVIGPDGDSQAIRMAMKVGARDYLSYPVAVEEITDTLMQISSRYVESVKHSRGQVISIINAKGGSGGSFISTNIAHLFADVENHRTALLDFDFQYGVQSLNLDIQIDHDLAEVVSMAPKLDPESMKGYLSKHKSGVHVLAERQENIVLASDIELSNISSLIENIEKAYDQVVVDLPRQVDPIFSTVVSHCHHILLVMQQTIAHVRDTKRLFGILVKELEIPPSRIMIIVNRYDKDNSVTIDAIEETVGHDNIMTLSNDYKRVAMATDMAIPLFSYAPNAMLTNELITICRRVSGNEVSTKKSFVNKVLGGFLNK